MSDDSRDSSAPHSQPAGGIFVPPSLDDLQAALPAYEVLEMIGAGGMGAVYKARQTSLDRLVAIKVLPAELAGRDALRFAERFQREAQAMAKMQHPASSPSTTSGKPPSRQPETPAGRGVPILRAATCPAKPWRRRKPPLPVRHRTCFTS